MAKTTKRAKDKKENPKIHQAILKQMLTLATSGFGLVAALAWNEAIKEAVTTYIKPFAAKGSGLISLLIYAIVVTILAVAVTYNLSRLTKKD